MSIESEYMLRITAVLKKRFPNLTADESIRLSAEILEVLPVEGLKR